MSPIFGFTFWMDPYLSVPESVYYLSIKYGLDHFYNLFYFRIELVLKSMHYLAVSSHFRWQDLTRWILNNSGQPSVDHHGPLGVSSGLILKYWRFEFFVVKNFFSQKAPPCFHLTVLHIFDCHSNGKITLQYSYSIGIKFLSKWFSWCWWQVKGVPKYALGITQLQTWTAGVNCPVWQKPQLFILPNNIDFLWFRTVVFMC